MNTDFLKSIDNKVSAILWITDKEHSTKSPFFDEIDYLTNGLLSKSKHFEGLYQTENFGKSLLVGLIKKNAQSKVLDSASSIVTNIKKQDSELQKIILLHNLNEDLSVKFEKKYSHYKFIEIKIEEES